MYFVLIGVPVAETEEAGYRASKKTTMAGLPLTNPTQKMLAQNRATSAAIGKKDPYADMGTMVLSPEKRGKNKKVSSPISSRSFLLERNNGSIVSSDEAKEVKGGGKNPYSEMGVSIDFPDKKSKSGKEKSDVKGKVTAVSERRMLGNKADPYSDLGSSSVSNDEKDEKSNRKSATENGTAKADVAEIAANLNKLIQKAKEISAKTSQGEGAAPTQDKVKGIEIGNATTAIKDPYADVGSLTKKTTKSVPGTKKDLESIVEAPHEEEFQDDSDVKRKSNQEQKPKQISGNSVTGVTGVTNSENQSKPQEKPQGYRKKDPYSDVGSAVDIKE